MTTTKLVSAHGPTFSWILGFLHLMAVFSASITNVCFPPQHSLEAVPTLGRGLFDIFGCGPKSSAVKAVLDSAHGAIAGSQTSVLWSLVNSIRDCSPAPVFRNDSRLHVKPDFCAHDTHSLLSRGDLSPLHCSRFRGRTGASHHKILEATSTPTLSIRRVGIYFSPFPIYFTAGTQDHFYFLCSHQTKDKLGQNRWIYL